MGGPYKPPIGIRQPFPCEGALRTLADSGVPHGKGADALAKKRVAWAVRGVTAASVCLYVLLSLIHI